MSTFWLYNFLILPLFQLLAPLVGLFNPKIKEIYKEQSQALLRIENKVHELKPQQTLWVHVSSAGEFLQARPVIEYIKLRKPNLTIILTFTSPAGVSWSQNYPHAHIIDYYPLDTRSNVRRLLQLIKPSAIVFIRYDFWINLIWQASKNQIPLFLISAALRSVSTREKFKIAKYFYSHIYSKFTHILTVNTEDRIRFLEATPQHPSVQVAGETRIDSVLLRQDSFIQSPLPTSLIELKKKNYKTLVVGSSWPENENVILPAWAQLKKEFPSQIQLILVPHEPTPQHLDDLSIQFKKLNLSWQLFSEFENNPKLEIDVLVVNKVGILAALYRIGDVAYVGSGHGGVHNVMEPAAWHLPVLFGPRYFNSPEAVHFVQSGFAQPIATVEECNNALLKLFNSPELCQHKGLGARKWLDESKGATQICSEAILKVL